MTKTFDAIVCEQNGKNFYCVILSKKILNQVCYVSRRDEDNIKGFQRLLNKSRANAIAKYMDIEKGVIPSALILSAQKKANFQYNQDTKKVSFDIEKNIFLVLDGQHRLYGIISSKSDYSIPVIIFNDLSVSEEVNLFVDINTNQKGVPTTLLIDIKNLTGKENSKEEKQRELFKLLNKNSVLAGYMNPTRSSVGKISKNTFNIATNEILENGYFADESVNVIYKGLKNYLEAAENVLNQTKSKNAKLTKSMIFRALFAIFPMIIETCLKKYGNLKVNSIEKELEPISLLNYDDYTGSSAALLKKIISEMKMEINKSQDYSFQFGSDIF